MSSKEPTYSAVKAEYVDVEDDSDTTLGSENGLSTKTRRRRRLHATISRRDTVLTWFRWGSIATLQIIMIVLVVQSSLSKNNGAWRAEDTETGGDINGLYIPTSHKYTLLATEEEKYIPEMSSNSDRLTIRKNWDKLMPLGSGSVAIPDYRKYPLLGEPITDDPIRKGPIFEASWTHALHCLYYSVDTYHQLVVNGTFGFGGERNDDHAAHCFEYLRNQILCSADMTLEGSKSTLDSTGNGQAHMCRDRSEAIAWIEARRLDDLQDIVGP